MENKKQAPGTYRLPAAGPLSDPSPPAKIGLALNHVSQYKRIARDLHIARDLQ